MITLIGLFIVNGLIRWLLPEQEIVQDILIVLSIIFLIIILQFFT